MQSLESPTSLNLLAPNGVVRVQFPVVLTADQCTALLAATEAAQSAHELAESLRELGSIWGITTIAEVVKKVPPE